jgi:serine/threonine protein kinase
MTDERNNRDSGQPDTEEPQLGAGEPDGEPAIDSEEERLVLLASRIDQGHPIDWEAAARDARDDRERAIIAEMRLLADVARVGREQAVAGDREAGLGPVGAEAVKAPGRGEAINDLDEMTQIAEQLAQRAELDPRDRLALDRLARGGQRGQRDQRDRSGQGDHSEAFDRDRSDERDQSDQSHQSDRSDQSDLGDQSFDLVGRHGGDAPPPATWGTLTIQSAIGRGAFSTVYRAQDNLGRLVALKLFPLQRQYGIDWTARLLHEGRLLARLRHENVVSVFGADQGDGYVGLWMELVNGRTLEDELRMRVRFSAEEAAQVGRVLCRALAAVHHAGLLHRDVKAHNVMRDDAGRIVLMDFGSGREAQIEETAPAADLAGTPLYLAPELFHGQPATIASDIYSLGVLLFHLVSDRYPIEGTNSSEIQRAHAERRRVWLRDVRPDLPESFVRVVELALTTDRTQRYQSAGALEDALAGISLQSSAASGGSSAPVVLPPTITTAPTLTEPTPKAPPPWRYRWQIMAAGAASVLALIAWVSVVPMMQRAGPGEPPRPSAAAPTPPATGPSASSYAVQATFFAQRNGRETTLAAGDHVIPGDTLGLRVTTSTPAYVYVANQDEEGDGFLLYPLRPDVVTPLAGQREHRLPVEENGNLWQVTSPGMREHLLVFVSQTPLVDFDQLWRELPRAEAGRPVTGPRIPRSAMVTRGVGGQAPAVQTPSRGLKRLFEQARPLSERQETTDGAWIRELTLVNPIKRTSRPPDPR